MQAQSSGSKLTHGACFLSHLHLLAITRKDMSVRGASEHGTHGFHGIAVPATTLLPPLQLLLYSVATSAQPPQSYYYRCCSPNTSYSHFLHLRTWRTLLCRSR